MPKAKNSIRSSAKTLRVLEALRELDGARVTELADYLNMNKGTVHHHLSTLRELKYVTKEGPTYELALRLFELGEYTRRQTDVYNVAKPEVDKLADEVGEMANLMIEDHGMGVYLYIARGENAVNLDTKIGTRQYLHTSALGKAILVNMPQEKFEYVLDEYGLPAETPNTVTDRTALEKELDEIRERGVAFDGEERAEGIRCVAAPITDKTGELIGAVSVSGPSSRLKNEWFRKDVPELVQDTATVIGINVSYS